MRKHTSRPSSPMDSRNGLGDDSPNLQLANSIREWRIQFEKGVQSRPHTLKKQQDHAATLLLLKRWEQYARGEIKKEELFGAQNEPYKVPFLPWIGQELTWSLLTRIWVEQRRRGNDAVTEFLKWCQWVLGPSRGRPTKPERLALGREVNQLRQRGKLWSLIARNLCPQREHLGHECTESCEDRLRMAENAFKATEP